MRRTGAGCSLLDGFVRIRYLDKAVDKNAGRYYRIRIDLTRLNELFNFRHDNLRRCRHQRVEITCRHSIDQIAFRISAVRVNESKVCEECAFHDIKNALELASFLSRRDLRTGSRSRVKRGNAGTAGANTFRQRALRVEFDVDGAVKVLRRKQFVLANVGRYDFPNLPCREQPPKTYAVHASVIRNDRQAFNANFMDDIDQAGWNPTQSEAACHDCHIVAQKIGQSDHRIRKYLVA